MRKSAPITGPHPDFARLIRETTGEVASRVVARRTGVSHDTISRMWVGDHVTESIILRFAHGYGVDPNPFLKALGYPPVNAFDGVKESGGGYGSRTGLPYLDGFAELDDASRQVVRETAEALVKALLTARRA